jgi:hypothetical protein
VNIRNDRLDEWNEGKAKNDDPYGGCVYKFAEAWADEMERRMKDGETIKAMAKLASHQVDSRPEFGITGFMYGAAVQVLSRIWEHGEELRQWHNLDTQIKNEGEVANKKGTVLNPAVIQIES